MNDEWLTVELKVPIDKLPESLKPRKYTKEEVIEMISKAYYEAIVTEWRHEVKKPIDEDIVNILNKLGESYPVSIDELKDKE